jgi:hypothetical protein
MPSPFPGMDPWLEDPVGWVEVHHRLITATADALVASLKPRYLVRIEERIYVDRDPLDPPWADDRRRRSDVAVVGGDTSAVAPAASPGRVATPVLVPTVVPEEVHEPFITIRTSRDEEVVTVFEILSPTNKRDQGSDGRKEYLSKRQQVLSSTANLVEVDLLRAGDRVPMARPLPPASYYVIVSPVGRRPLCEVYPIQLRDRLPTVALPLAGKETVALDLQGCLDLVFDRAGYDVSLRHEAPPPPPPLDPEDLAWARALLDARPSRA